jgi:hydroxymethylpyrimidine/phosphomethylpyrimidine kinase
MLGTAAIAQAVAEGLSGPISTGRLPHLVVDPVMVAKSGDRLLDRAAISTLIEAVLPLATVITPNLPEAGVLLDARPPDSLREMARVAERLRRLLRDDGRRWVLVKGGHLEDGSAADVLWTDGALHWLEGARTPGVHTHGTGCSLSSAIATQLAHGESLPQAVRLAQDYVHQALLQAQSMQLGSGAGLAL